MALIIENGSTVIGANSYVTVTEAKNYATARLENFPTDDAAVEALLIDAMDYLEALRRQFQGTKASTEQELQWPRLTVVIDGENFASDAIPKELKNAQCQLAIDSYAVGGLAPSTDGYAASKEKVDVIEVEYATSNDATAAMPTFPKADKWLEPLLKNSSGMLSTRRV